MLQETPPITLLKVAYNNLAKEIALKVHNVVRREQTSFVWGFILDTMISAEFSSKEPLDLC